MRTFRLQLLVFLALFLAMAVVILLAPAPAKCEPYIAVREITDSATIAAEREIAAHPERYVGNQWFERTPRGDASRLRYIAMFPNLPRGKELASEAKWREQVRRHNEAVTGKPFKFPWEGR